MEVARAGLASVVHGQARALIAVGEPGVGKTRFLREVLSSAGQQGVSGVRVACLPLVTPLPFEPLLGLLRSLRRSGRLRGQRGHDPKLGADPFGEALMLLEHASSAGPLVLAVDDLHWSDRATLDLLHYCVVRLAEAPILWSLASRQASAVEALGHHLGREGLCERVELLPLDEAQLGELVRGRLGAEVSDAFVRAVYARTGGNPFLAEELLTSVGTTTGFSALAGQQDERRVREALAEAVPTTIMRSIADRAELLGPEAREMLAWASVLPEPLEPAWLAAVCGGTREATESLQELYRALLVEPAGEGRWQFRHSLIRDARYKAMDENERFRRHQAAVALLIASGAQPTVLAPQLAGAGCHQEAALAYLELGNQALARSGAEDALELFKEAADHARRAREPGTARRAEAGSVIALLRLGQTEEAVRLAEQLRASLRASGDGNLRLSFLTHYALALEEHGSELEAALGALAEAEPLLEQDALAPKELAEALLARAYVLTMAGRAAEAVPGAAQALSLAESVGDALLVVKSLNRLGLAVGLAEGSAQANEILRRAVALARAHDLLSEHALACLNLSYFADVAGDEEGHESWAKAALELGGTSPGVEALLRSNIASALAWRGDLDGSLAYHLSARSVASRVGKKTEDRALLSLCFTLVRRGDLDEARRLLKGLPMVPSSFDHYRRLAALGGLYEEEGDLHEALCTYLEAASAKDHPVTLSCLYDATRVAALQGDAAQARAAFARLLQVAPRWDSSGLLSRTAKAWVDLAEGRNAEAAEALGRLSQQWKDPFEAARCSLEAAKLLRDRQAFASAIAALEKMGAKRACDRARSAARAAGFRPGRQPRGSSPLTKREREVALLVASGMSNHEVARALYLSPRTVERHVGSVFMKLGLRSRAKLTAEVSAGRLPA